MRALLLLVLLTAPTVAAGGATLDAPARAPAGLDVLVRVCLEPGGAAWRLALLLDGREVDGAPYAPGEGCFDATVRPPPVEGNATLRLRLRSEGGTARTAVETPLVLLAATPVAVAAEGAAAELRGVDGRVALRVPVEGGLALLPAWEDTDAPRPTRLLVEAAHEGATEGVVLRNAGDAEARLGRHALLMGARTILLPDVALAPGEAIHLGVGAPPEPARHAKVDIDVRRGNVSLIAGRVERDRLEVPALPDGHAATRAGVHRLGTTRGDAARSFAGVGGLVAYATPDAGAAPLVAVLDGAREEVLLTGYTFTSPEFGAALLRARARGVDVRVLLEGAPVGGRPAAEEALVAALVAEGAEVAFLESAPGFPTRYRTLHAKTLVVDRRSAVVATENFHDTSYPAFAGAPGNRGFGVIVHDAALARALADVFTADAAPWPDVRRAASEDLPAPARPVPRAGGRAGPVTTEDGAWRATLVLSPDHAREVVTLIEGATSRVDVAMLFAESAFGDRPNPFLDALVMAARRGVEVRLLLDGEVDDGRNRATVERLVALAREEGIPLVARVDPAPRVLHAKLVLVDASRLYVGSMNWGRASMEDNRETGLILDAPAVAVAFGEVFARDIGAGPSTPVALPHAPLVAALALILASSVRAARRRRPR